MRTLIVSDLHLGSRGGTDLLRFEPIQRRLFDAMRDADRVVLLGDVLELRQGPAWDAMTRAQETLSALGAAAAHAEVVLVPGNHDYDLIAPWLDARSSRGSPPPLELEHRIAVGDASPLAATMAEWMGVPAITVAYPGVWLSDDVYATHGHYLDCHATVPTFERMAAGVMTWVVGALPPGRLTPDDYERRLAPIYAWMGAVTERGGGRFGIESVRAWQLLAGDGHRPLRARALARAFPLGVAALNRAGLGPISSDLSRAALRSAGVVAMAQVVARLGIPADHVVFGHSHRAGPLPGDDAGEWSPGGPRLANSGCWVYEPTFMARASAGSPFWPGACVVLDDEGPPRLERLLEGVTPEELASMRGHGSEAPAR
ncbi:MAG TPA: metallophosphoesterase [Solirubrobacteraceae bacterium]|jgi:predicted phosphodiesterase|nr:metallophosphoesterase [Solirubrobacteraceae bacterium]